LFNWFFWGHQAELRFHGNKIHEIIGPTET
jgi:hypothetical protein